MVKKHKIWLSAMVLCLSIGILIFVVPTRGIKKTEQTPSVNTPRTRSEAEPLKRTNEELKKQQEAEKLRKKAVRKQKGGWSIKKVIKVIIAVVFVAIVLVGIYVMWKGRQIKKMVQEVDQALQRWQVEYKELRNWDMSEKTLGILDLLRGAEGIEEDRQKMRALYHRMETMIEDIVKLESYGAKTCRNLRSRLRKKGENMIDTTDEMQEKVKQICLVALDKKSSYLKTDEEDGSVKMMKIGMKMMRRGLKTIENNNKLKLNIWRKERLIKERLINEKLSVLFVSPNTNMSAGEKTRRDGKNIYNGGWKPLRDKYSGSVINDKTLKKILEMLDIIDSE